MLCCIPDSISSTGQFQITVSVYMNSSVQVSSIVLREISKLPPLTMSYLIHRSQSTWIDFWMKFTWRHGLGVYPKCSDPLLGLLCQDGSKNTPKFLFIFYLEYNISLYKPNSIVLHYFLILKFPQCNDLFNLPALGMSSTPFRAVSSPQKRAYSLLKAMHPNLKGI